MRMRRLKRRKGESFGKRFEGDHWENRKGVRKNEIEGLDDRKISFSVRKKLCIYRTPQAVEKTIRIPRYSRLIIAYIILLISIPSFHNICEIPFFPMPETLDREIPLNKKTPALHSLRAGHSSLRASDSFIVVLPPVLQQSQAHTVTTVYTDRCQGSDSQEIRKNIPLLEPSWIIWTDNSAL